MIEIVVNGQPETSDKLNLAELVAEKNAGDGHFAVAVNECFIPKARYAEIQLQSGDRIEMVKPMSGG